MFIDKWIYNKDISGSNKFISGKANQDVVIMGLPGRNPLIKALKVCA
jgi:hypothetical protein